MSQKDHPAFTIAPAIINAVQLLESVCYDASKLAGWHTNRNSGLPFTQEEQDERFPLRIALIHSELSEALEGHRKNLQDTHLPLRRSAEVELADALIRIFDLAGAMKYDLGDALLEKLRFNVSREDHTLAARAAAHGKKY